MYPVEAEEEAKARYVPPERRVYRIWYWTWRDERAGRLSTAAHGMWFPNEISPIPELEGLFVPGATRCVQLPIVTV